MALALWLLGRLLLLLIVVVHVAVCRPRTTVAVFGAAGVVWAVVVHPYAATVAGFLVVEAANLCSLAAPGSVRRRLLGWWRSVFVYRRQWQAAMVVAELDRDGVLPRLRRVRCTDAADLVSVRGLLGQRFADWEEAAPMLAHVFGATAFVVHRGDDRRLTLELLRGRRGRSWSRGALDYGPEP